MLKKNKNQTPVNKLYQDTNAILGKKEIPVVSNRLEFLAMSGIQLSKIDNQDELFKFLAQKTHQIIQKGIVMVSVIDNNNRKWESVAIEGVNALSQAAPEFFGNKRSKTNGWVITGFPENIKRGVLTKLNNHFVELVESFLGLTVSEKADTIHGIKAVYGIPFFNKSKIFGILSVVESENTPPIDKDLIEAFMLQFSAVFEKLYVEELSKNSEEKFRKLFDAANVGVSVSTKDGKVLEANKVACEIIGLDKDDIKFLLVRDLYYSEADRLSLISQIADKGEVDNYPVRFNTKNGKIKWINLSLKSIFIDNEECYISTLVDITDVKEAEQALLNSEREIRKIIDESPLPIVILKKEGEIEYLNDKFNAVFGYTINDIVHVEDWWQKAYVDTEARQRALVKWGQMLKDEHISADSYIDCKNGERKFVEIYTTIIGHKIIAMFADQTEKNRLEIENKEYRENLEGLVKNRTSELEEKNRELERMNNLFVGREFRIKELKDRIEILEKQLGK